MNAPGLNRRQFTAGLGAIVVAFSLDPRHAAGQEPPRLPGSLQTNRKLDGWLRINADGTATVFTGKVELGQGILTPVEADSTGNRDEDQTGRHHLHPRDQVLDRLDHRLKTS